MTKADKTISEAVSKVLKIINSPYKTDEEIIALLTVEEIKGNPIKDYMLEIFKAGQATQLEEIIAMVENKRRKSTQFVMSWKDIDGFYIPRDAVEKDFEDLLKQLSGQVL